MADPCIPGPLGCEPAVKNLNDGTHVRMLSPLSGPIGTKTPNVHSKPPVTSSNIPATQKVSKYVIYLYNKDLIRVSPVFATIYPGWTQRVEVIYTEGRADKVWADAGVRASEVLAGVAFACAGREKAKHLNGIIAVDLAVAAKNPSVAATNTRFDPVRPTLKEMRERLFKTLTHELLHVLQAWVFGDDWNRMYSEAGEYGKNRYEKAAFKFGDDWVQENRDQLAAGEFDSFIPIEVLSTSP